LKKRIVRIITPVAAHKLDVRKKSLLGVAGFLAIAVPVAFGVAYAAPSAVRHGRQSQNAGANMREYKYEVASIKPTKSNPNSHHSDTTDDELRAVNVSLTRLIRQAFLSQFGPAGDDGRVVGAPNWADSDGFDVEAKMDTSTADALKKLNPVEREAARQRMLQSLLEDRFKLAVHSETKTFPVYVLSLGKSASKLHEAKPGETYATGYKLPNGRPAGGGFHSDEDGKVTAQGVTIDNLASWLSRRLGRKVVDKTGLTGMYDFSFSWTRDDNDGPGDPQVSPILMAVQEQLGLKLESGKGPVEIIVIDHAEKPSGN